MSTKIYTAYRTKTNIFELIPIWREKSIINIKKEIKKLFKRTELQYKTTSEFYNTLFDRYKQASQGQTRDAFDFDVSITVRKYQNYYYIIPYCDSLMRDCLNFLKRDKNLENYAYWNNTDQPNHISNKKWRERGAIWDNIDEGDNWRNYVSIEVCTLSNFYSIISYQDLSKWKRKPKGENMKLSEKQATLATKYFVMSNMAFQGIVNIKDVDSLELEWSRFQNNFMADLIGECGPEAEDGINEEYNEWYKKFENDDEFCLKEITKELPWLILASVA